MVLEIFEVEHCDKGFHLGFLIGQRFSSLVQNRQTLSCNTNFFPSQVRTCSSHNQRPLHFQQTPLLNFRKEILPFIPKAEKDPLATISDDCSDVLVVNDSMAMVVFITRC